MNKRQHSQNVLLIAMSSQSKCIAYTIYNLFSDTFQGQLLHSFTTDI